MLSFVKNLVKKLRSYIPKTLPQGMTEFESLVKEVKALDPVIGALEDRSVRFAIATMIINNGHKTSKVPTHFFVTQLQLAATKQVAAEIFQEIKAQQKAEMEEAKKAALLKTTEDSVAPVATDGPK
jgi:hypothetical protein